MDQPLRKEGLLALRNRDRVDDDVVDEIRPHGGGISEIAHLHRRRAIGRYLRPCVIGVALEIDQDVDLVRMNAFCRVAMGHRINFDEPVERTIKPRAHWALVVRAIGIGQDLEAIAIVAFEQLGHQLRGRMLMKIAG